MRCLPDGFSSYLPFSNPEPYFTKVSPASIASWFIWLMFLRYSHEHYILRITAPSALQPHPYVSIFLSNCPEYSLFANILCIFISRLLLWFNNFTTYCLFAIHEDIFVYGKAFFTIISFDTDCLEPQPADFILGDNTFSAIFLTMLYRNHDAVWTCCRNSFLKLPVVAAIKILFVLKDYAVPFLSFVKTNDK